MNKKILVTGGAGYIGSITVKQLLEKGFDVVVFDNLVNGHNTNVSCPLVVGDLTDKESLFKSLEGYEFDGVIHFAAYTLPGESMQNPYKYFHANLQGGLNLLELMKKKNIPSIIFSSTCALYGYPKHLPVSEDEEKKPESVYGESKLLFERILDWYDTLYDIHHINLRYFNAAGAALDGSLGERHNPETHIIPLAIKAILENRPFDLFGADYPTPDGTCIRDYIHVEDLGRAHILALQKLQQTKKSNSYNLGTGKGFSNREILSMIEKVSGKKITIEEKPRRTGDPAIIYADNAKAKKELGWIPQHSDLETIVKTAYDWYSKHAK